METIYKGLVVKDDGRVLKEIGQKGNKGYRYISLGGKLVLKHRLIWEAFNGEIPQGMEIDHIIPVSDGGTDELSNLRLVTSSENKRNPNTFKKYHLSNKNKSSHLKKKIEQINIETGEVIKIYDSIADANTEGYRRTEISKCLHNKQEKYKGYYWRFH